ncbi:hypothetical protein NX783_13600 [Massilia kyonggiensis]|nr:hypothetical protein [Massilia kyonggiensis]
MDGFALAQVPLSIVEQKMVNDVRKKLVGAQDYEGKVKNWFDLLVVRLCKFLTFRVDAGTMKDHFRYLKRVDDRTKLPHESELQKDLFDFLLSTTISPLLEVPHIAAGRTDIYLPFAGFRFIIEVKRSTSVVWSCFSARPHSRQAAAYSTADVRLGVLATLDLSVREPGVPHVSECFGVIRRKLSRSDERTVVFLRVPGNRLSPSTLSN